MTVKVGCCGFPEAKSKYYKHFSVVELQQTFYQPPELKTVAKWKEEAPTTFEFTLKAWQLITHPATSPTYRRLKITIPENKKKYYGNFQNSAEVFKAWEETEKVARILNAKIIVFQCPASFTPSEENKKNLINFFKSIKRNNYFFVWEPRGKWQPEEIKEICQELNLIHCVDPFQSESTYGTFAYYRLHGIDGYRYKYTTEDLLKLKKKCTEKKLVYCMFNNVHMLEDALTFKKLIDEN